MPIVGVIDSGYRLPAASWLIEQQRFFIEDGYLYSDSGIADPSGHGTAVIDVIRKHAAPTRIYSAQVLDSQGRSSTMQIQAAIEWLLSLNVMQINLSLGLNADNPALRQVCADAVSQGVVLVASSPAMGRRVFPAAYQGVIAVTGDARVKPVEWSWFQTNNDMAEYGAHVFGPGGQAGASIACAHLSGVIATYRQVYPQAALKDVVAHLQNNAGRTGPQKREPFNGLSK